MLVILVNWLFYARNFVSMEINSIDASELFTQHFPDRFVKEFQTKIAARLQALMRMKVTCRRMQHKKSIFFFTKM